MVEFLPGGKGDGTIKDGTPGCLDATPWKALIDVASVFNVNHNHDSDTVHVIPMYPHVLSMVIWSGYVKLYLSVCITACVRHGQ